MHANQDHKNEYIALKYVIHHRFNTQDCIDTMLERDLGTHSVLLEMFYEVPDVLALWQTKSSWRKLLHKNSKGAFAEIA